MSALLKFMKNIHVVVTSEPRLLIFLRPSVMMTVEFTLCCYLAAEVILAGSLIPTALCSQDACITLFSSKYETAVG